MKITQPPPRIRTLVALAIAYVPIGALRTALYSALFGYRFGPGARIGLGVVITCDGFSCGSGSFIGRENRFLGPFRAEIGDGVIIGRYNRFTAGMAAADPAKAGMGYARTLLIGDRALINDNHFFDLYGKLEIGARTWVAGMYSQFWTHGASVLDRDITIGSDCYLGTSVLFAPGASLPDNCVLGLGSVVVNRLTETHCVFAGNPAKKLREIRPEDTRQFAFEMS